MMRFSGLVLVMLAAPLAAQDAPPAFDGARGAPLTIGQWHYGLSATGSEARFGTSFAIVCNRSARLVTLRRIDGAGGVGAAAAGPLTIVTDLGVRTLPANGIVAVSDPLLDAIAFSRGRFIISGGGGPRIILPVLPEAARSIEDCRI